MTFPMSAKKSMACVPLVLALASGGLRAASGPNLPPDLNGIGIEQRLNAQIPLDTTFRDESGASVQLRTLLPETSRWSWRRCTIAAPCCAARF